MIGQKYISRKGYIEYITCTINGVQDRWQYQEKIMSTNSLYLIMTRKYLLLKCIEARYRVQMWNIKFSLMVAKSIICLLHLELLYHVFGRACTALNERVQDSNKQLIQGGGTILLLHSELPHQKFSPMQLGM